MKETDKPELPAVDPEASDYLEQLFAWGDAFVARTGITEEDVRRAEECAKERLRKVESQRMALERCKGKLLAMMCDLATYGLIEQQVYEACVAFINGFGPEAAQQFGDYVEELLAFSDDRSRRAGKTPGRHLQRIK